MINCHADGFCADFKIDSGDSTIETAAGSHNALRYSDSYQPPQGKHCTIALLGTT